MRLFAFFLLLAALVLLADAARSAPITQREHILRVYPSLMSAKEPSVDAGELADAILATHPGPGWTALLLTVAHHESAMSARIARGECRPLECDRGRAWGLFQQHRNTFNSDAWGSKDLRVQALEASHALRRAFYQCQHGQPLNPNWVRRTLSAYKGASCDATWKGLDERVATYNRIGWF